MMKAWCGTCTRLHVFVKRPTLYSVAPAITRVFLVLLMERKKRVHAVRRQHEYTRGRRLGEEEDRKKSRKLNNGWRQHTRDKLECTTRLNESKSSSTSHDSMSRKAHAAVVRQGWRERVRRESAPSSLMEGERGERAWSQVMADG